MFRTCSILTLCVMIMSVCASETNTHNICEYDDISVWDDFTQKVLKTSAEKYILDIAVSKHTENLYIATFGDNILRVLEKQDSFSERKVAIKTVGYINAVTCDNYFPIVYVGTDKGLYIYNEMNDEVLKVPEIRRHVYKLFSPKNSTDLYLVTKDGYKVYRYKDNYPEIDLNIHISASWDANFVVDLDGNYIYTTEENGEFVTKILLEGDSSPSTYSHNGRAFLTPSVDNVGKVYGVIDRDIYLLNVDGSEPQLVTTLDFDLRCMCFDNNNHAVLGGKDNRVVIFEFDYNCTISDTPKVNHTETLENNMTGREYNESIYDKMFDYRNIMLAENKLFIENITYTANQLKYILDENNLELETKLKAMENRIDQIEDDVAKMDNVDDREATHMLGSHDTPVQSLHLYNILNPTFIVNNYKIDDDDE